MNVFAFVLFLNGVVILENHGAVLENYVQYLLIPQGLLVGKVSVLLSLAVLFFPVGIESFLMYSVHEGIRGIPLDPNDKMDALMPISGASFAVGIDFHAGKFYV